MDLILKSVVALSMILSLAMAYPYPYPGSNFDDGDGEVTYQMPSYDRSYQYIPLHRFARAAPQPPQHLSNHRGGGRDRIVLIPEGMQMQMRGDTRGDLIPAAASNKEPITAETGYGHSSHPYDYVDYGAYTGGYGAFGWYSDHPVHTYGGGGYH